MKMKIKKMNHSTVTKVNVKPEYSGSDLVLTVATHMDEQIS